MPEFNILLECPTPYRKVCFKDNCNILASKELAIESSLIENGYLCLFVDPDNYQPIYEGGSSRLVTTGVGNSIEASKSRRGFSIRLDYIFNNVRIALNTINRYALNNKLFVECKDYVLPDDDIASYVNGYTTRYGIISAPLTTTGSISKMVPESKENINLVPSVYPAYISNMSLTFTSTTFNY